LGNNGASTEKEILDMAQRIAGAASTVGASESDVLALSNTLASMGIRAEQGGGVATRVILKMRSAVDEGGESLETFAQL
ncbi:phage tail tape measure protein, partial [Enterococcus faecalis]